MKLKFIHIPRTAGTSIEDHYIKYNIRYGRFDSEYCNETLKQQNIWGAQAEKWHSVLPSHSYLWDKYRFFTIIRNPVDRIISEYYQPYQHKNILLQKTTESINDFNKNIKYILNLIKTSNNIAGHYSSQINFLNLHHLDKIDILDFHNINKEIELLHISNNIVTAPLDTISGHSIAKKVGFNDLYKEIQQIFYDVYRIDINLYQLVHNNHFQHINKIDKLFNTIFDIC